ncbi:hypothetical protein TorRG33x02_031210 [Trema orientale]|uniref:Glabrous enhancer-binding protein-like DBD domain-containing protein n=1 Tax=Trema orientale TaxID=63057 RepID=A0A2P5FT08_TREOI|nr:hypothetical protein TorRG33x02_031210 [Trema orientale]
MEDDRHSHLQNEENHHEDHQVGLNGNQNNHHHDYESASEVERAARKRRRVRNDDAEAMVQNEDEDEEEEEAAFDEVSDNNKLQPFKRFWSPKHELIILKRLMRFAEKKKCKPSQVKMSKFYAYLKKIITDLDFDKIQLSDKVRRMKTKFENKMRKKPDSVYPDKKDQRIFQLSELIWGNEMRAVAKNVTSRSEESVNKDFAEMLKQINTDHKNSLLDGLTTMIATPVKAELARKWQILHFDYFRSRSRIEQKVFSLALGKSGSSSN